MTSHSVEPTGSIGNTLPDTMRAIVQDTYGSAEVLRLAQIEVPDVAADEVLVRVHAAGLDRGTWHLMTGKPYAMRLALGFRGPKNPVSGLDVAGVVVAIGSKVSRFSIGDEVFGFGKGTFADYAVARVDKVALKPANMTFEQAAAVPVSAATALQALCDSGRIENGQSVLVIGASGGVGTYAVQLAKALGTEVTGVCSAGKADLVRSLGADHVIDYAQQDFADDDQRFDLILDIAGNPSPSHLRRALTPKGTAVIVGGEEGGNMTGGMGRQLRALMLSVVVRQRLTMFIAKQRAADLERIAGFLAAGTITPSLDRTYPLEQAPEAMRRLEAGDVRGKIVITVVV